MIVQIIIGICGLASIWLTQQKNENLRRYACIVGVIASPFWMITTWQAEQYGMFVLSFIYLLAWLDGVKNYWIKK